ncbi:UNVERIFIED_CONTAM: cytochrome [Sesamum latifolium]|uniref:Cytochrome n=1 Tax=Sesamum latifolium TaxID=2727402 RepID=A0AAW2UFZ4_9LAMI
MVRVVAGDVESDEKWHEVITEFLRAMGVLTVADVLPYLKWLDWFGGVKRAKKTGKEMDRLLQGWLKEHKKHSRTCERDESFMAEMMRVADGIAREFPDHDADTITKATCQGSRRTRQAHRQRKTSKESDLEKLVYIQAIIKETLRLQPPAPLLPPRESVEDCTVAGYHIPAGTRLMVNAWKLHRDPRVWTDPLEFRPERFLAEYKEVDVRGKQFELLPFGGGRRICPGISFSLGLMELALANLLHGFDIEKLSDDQIIDMTSSFGATNMKATPLEVLLKPRLSPSLYA